MNLLMDMRYACDRFPGIGRMSAALCQAFATHPTVTQLSLITNAHNRNTRITLPTAPHIDHIILDAPSFGGYEAWQLARLVAHRRPDWVYTPYLRLPWVPIRSRLAVTVHDAIPFTQPAPWWVRLGLRIAWLDTALRADLITTVSPAAAHDITQHLWPHRPVHVIPNGIDTRFFQPAPALDLTPLGIHGEYDLCVSSNQPHKNLATLVAAWAHTYTHTPTASSRQLVIAGQFDDTRPQPWRDPYYRDIPIVVLAAPSDDVLHTLYQRATLFVYPSLAEGFGLTIAEAMASGCAIICHEHPAIRALVADNAWVIDMHDITALQHALSQAWHADTQRRLFADAVRQRAHQYDWEHAAAAYIHAMQQHT